MFDKCKTVGGDKVYFVNFPATARIPSRGSRNPPIPRILSRGHITPPLNDESICFLNKYAIPT